MADTAVLDVSELTFERDVLQKSHDVPVVVDFWAAWCGPCRVLGPLLERLAAEAGGAWVLAKVDVDANPGLAASFGIQGIPAVRGFRGGRQVAEFVGALPEPEIRKWLTQLRPSPADLAFEEGAAAEARGDDAAAAQAYRRTLDLDPGHAAAREASARVELRLRARPADENALRTRLGADAGDVDAAIALADIEASRGELEAAFGHLLQVVRSRTGDERERARRHLLSLLDTLAPGDPRALATRRSLAALLY